MRSFEQPLETPNNQPLQVSEPLLDLLRAWWLAARERGVMLPGGWLFPGQNPVNPLTTRQLRRAFHGAKEAAGIDKRVSLHTVAQADDKADTLSYPCQRAAAGQDGVAVELKKRALAADGAGRLSQVVGD